MVINKVYEDIIGIIHYLKFNSEMFHQKDYTEDHFLKREKMKVLKYFVALIFLIFYEIK